MEKSLTLKYKLKGLFIYCYRCGTIITDGVCPHPEAQIYKAIAHVRGTKNGRKTKALGRISEAEAVKMTLDFAKEVNGEVEKIVIENKQPEKPIVKAKTLMSLSGRYYGFLAGDEKIVPAYMKEKESCSKSHLSDVNRTFTQLFLCLKKAGRDVNNMMPEDIDSNAIEIFHEYILNELGLSNRSYNKAITILSSFYRHMRKFEKIDMQNIFETVPHKPTQTNVTTLEQDEYERLIEIVQKPELGKCKTGKEVKQLWRPFLGDFIEAGLETGRRIEEISLMKWENVIFNKEGLPQCIKIEDFKANRIKNRQGDQKKYIFVPVTESLNKLLIRWGLNEYRHSNEYILAPEDPMKRDVLKRLISRAFTHYYKQLKTGKTDITFKTLRRTYISRLTASIGLDNARLITKHSGLQVMEQAYLDQKVIASTAKNFKVFDRNKSVLKRENEIKEIRERKVEKQINIER